jgi:hypothetical protein
MSSQSTYSTWTFGPSAWYMSGGYPMFYYDRYLLIN